MKNIFKTTTLALCVLCLASNNVQAAPAFKTVSELFECLIGTTNGNSKTEYEIPSVITSVQQWKSTIATATAGLTNSVTLTIANFNEEDYSLDLISNYNVAISAKGTLRQNTANITYTFTYSPNYKIMRAYEDKSLLPVLTNEELAALTKAKGIVAEIITSDMTDYEKELAIHDYIIKNYQYDVPAATDKKANVVRTHSITGMLLDGKGVCEAYSNTFMLLCRLSGLNCTLATGMLDGSKHQWNIIELNGEYYNVDLTYDDPVPDIAGKVRYNCFNVNDKQLAQTHIIDKENISCEGARYNYYSYNNLTVTNREDLLILLNDKLDRGLREITFKTQGGYILYNADDIKAAANNRGLNSVTVVGDYGKDGIFNVVFN